MFDKSVKIFICTILCCISALIIISMHNSEKILCNQSTIIETIKNVGHTDVDNEENYIITPVPTPIMVNIPECTTFICPYCHGGLTWFSSSGEISVAQLRCYHCDFQTPSVHINKPNSELDCELLLTEKLKTNKWEEKDFLGE